MLQMKKHFQYIFGITKILAWQYIKTLQLFPGDSVDLLVEKIKSLLRIITEESPNEHLVAVFLLDSLPEQVSEIVKTQHGSDMNLTRIVLAAKNLLSTVNDCQRGEFCHTSIREKNYTSSRQKLSAKSSRCYCCNQLGHTRNDCHVKCFNCGKRGHLKSDCYSKLFPGNEVAGVERSEATTSARKQ